LLTKYYYYAADLRKRPGYHIGERLLVSVICILSINVSSTASLGGEGTVQADVIVGGMTSTPTLVITENVGIHPNTPSGTTIFSLTTLDGGTRQGVRVDSVCPVGGCTDDHHWSVTLFAPNTSTTDDGYTYAETGPTTYKALLQTTGPIEPGDYTVKIETLWIY
jgi:hypothetical protein